ncbi:hypothetical protein CSOJ01_05799 [Colletotrichum sojae]|uniref:F-box domain-containing protein n=1 Tax=Colletotrichum sojae TaxID=2175907 RepID=A0A8H6MX02_9PEZI|nr:hypothetical protein CSOJ01_05799 [Colletotrichum sojae]
MNESPRIFEYLVFGSVRSRTLKLGHHKMFPLLSLPVPVIEDTIKLLCPHCYPTTRENRWTCHCALGCHGHDCVWEPEKRAALASLCQTNKLLNFIATPFLYHSPTHRSNGHCRLRTVYGSRRDLARHVRTVHLAGPGGHFESQFPDESELFKNARAHVGVDPDPDASEHGDKVRFFMGLLLATCTGIRELCIPAAYYDHYDQPLAPFFCPGSLPRLETLGVIYDDEGGFDTDHLPDLFSAATNLRTFRAWGLSGVTPGLNLGSLRELRLFKSVVQAEDLSLLLERCRQLERFTYFTGDPIITDEGPPSPREIQDVILDKVPQLTDLELTTWENLWFDDLTDDDVLRDLKGLEQLREVRLDPDFLIPTANDPERREWVIWADRFQAPVLSRPCVRPEVLVDMLPVSIKKLQIGVPDTGGSTDVLPLVPAIRKLGQVCKKKFPNLVAVAFSGLGDDEEQVRKLFEERGVTFLISKDSDLA